MSDEKRICVVKGCSGVVHTRGKRRCSYHLAYPHMTEICPNCGGWKSRKGELCRDCLHPEAKNRPQPVSRYKIELQIRRNELRDLRSLYRGRIREIGSLGDAARERLPFIEEEMIKLGSIKKRTKIVKQGMRAEG